MRFWLQLLLVAALFYCGAKLSLAFAVMPEVLVMLWIPNGIVLAAWLRDRRGALWWAPAIVAAEVAADWPTFSVVEAMSFGAINVAEVAIAYALLRRWRFDSTFAAPADIAKFIVAGPVISAFLSASAAAAVYSQFRGAATGYGEFLRVWWFSDGLGLLVVTPLVLSFSAPRRESMRFRWYDGLALAGAALIAAAFAFSHQRSFHGLTLRPFLMIPPALYFTARFGMRTTTTAAAAVAALILSMTKNGQQPFGAVSIRETVVSAQELIFVVAATSLSLGALLSQHRRHARELEARVRERTAALSAANERLQTLATTDSLTGLPNRRALFELLQREMHRDKRYRHAFALIVFDLDHFKNVNDRWGHETGDVVLQRAAAVAHAALRSADTMARYGGEEFVIVAPETDRSGAAQLAERVRAALGATPIEVAGEVLSVTASFGVALFEPGDETPEPILRRADRALYAAKAAGRDRVVVD